MSDSLKLTPDEKRIIAYSLSRMCAGFERDHISLQATIDTTHHLWKHPKGRAVVLPVTFSPVAALELLDKLVRSISQPPDEP